MAGSAQLEQQYPPAAPAVPDHWEHHWEQHDAGAAPPSPLPGTPGGVAPLPWQQAQGEPALGTPMLLGTPAMGTPGHGAGLDVPAGTTPPSARFTPGQPALADGLLGGFTPSPLPGGANSQQHVAQPTPWVPAMPAWQGAGYEPGGAESPAPLADAFPALPAAGGPQVAPEGAPKPAFAAWSAAAAAGRAQQQTGGGSQLAPAGQGRSGPLKHPCGACGAAEAVHVWVPCGHVFCGGCAGSDKPAACSACGATATHVRMW